MICTDWGGLDPVIFVEQAFSDLARHARLGATIADDIAGRSGLSRTELDALPNGGFFLVLDTAAHDIRRVEEFANTYRQRMEELDDRGVHIPVAEWYAYVTGGLTWPQLPPGLTVVTNDTIKAPTYRTISDYAVSNALHLVD